MKIGSIDITKAYIGGLELTSNNAYLGTTKLIEGGGTTYTPLTFEALSDSTTVGITNNGGNTPNLQYSLDGTNWTDWDYTAISLNTGDKLRLRGNNGTQFNTSSSVRSTFTTSANIKCYGEIMSILDGGTGTGTEVGDYGLRQLFAGTKITTAPVFSMEKVGKLGFYEIFYNCKQLTAAPELPATTFGARAYMYMFEECTKLTTPPSVLPATTITAERVYAQMFYDCTSLTYSPIIMATTMSSGLVTQMFYGCSKLSKVTTYFTAVDSSNMNMWLTDVASTGDFYNLGGATYSSGTSGIPSGWTEHTSL